MRMHVPVADLDAMLKQLHLPTIRRLYAELACAPRMNEGRPYRTYLEILAAEEIAQRAETRINRSVGKARFPFLCIIEEFDFTFQTSIRLQMLGSFLGPDTSATVAVRFSAAHRVSGRRRQDPYT